jgi:Protein of unknown function (DUF1559)
MNRLPFPGIEKDGKPAMGDKPLLSWRVAILPYMNYDSLYKQFKLDEPWDSAHNKRLLAQMPAEFAAPAADRASGQTQYRIFTGPQAIRPGTNLASFSDGTSNTLLVVEAVESVPWTKPDELSYDAKKPPPRLGGTFADGFVAVKADGAPVIIPHSIPEKILRAAITPNGGEKMPQNWEQGGP